jgi:glucose-1-phosphate thymidylyltransferase
MKLIIPMAGMGKRMRPHTLQVPKPLIKVAGKPIVERIIENLNESNNGIIEEIHFVIGEFGKKTEKELLAIANSCNAKGFIHYQKEAKGTAHAIYCAKEALNGNVLIAFADTLFTGKIEVDNAKDGIIWVKKVDDPSKFGVVKTDNEDVITEFIEKPKNNISNNAIVGIYYFKEAEHLNKQIEEIINRDIIENGEYQLTNALEYLKDNGAAIKIKEIDQWLDCGNVEATLNANRCVLEHSQPVLNHNDYEVNNAIVIPPCYIAKGTLIKNCIIGPFVSINDGVRVESCVIKNSILNSNSVVKNTVIENSFIGANNSIDGSTISINTGDFTILKL